jgi:hypothetical protein
MTFAAAAAFALFGCVHVRPTPQGPEAVARDFAAKLKAGELEHAWSLTTGVTREEFLVRYSSPQAREQRAEGVAKAAAGELTATAFKLVYAQRWLVQEAADPVPSNAEVQKVLSEFLDAAERRDFSAAWTMLSARWRARYTPARLQTDFDAEPQVKERLARARAALAGPWKVERDAAALGLGEGRTLKLEREGELWRVAALE